MKVILFGAGRMTEKLLEEGLLSEYDIKAIADNDKKKQGTKLIFSGRSYHVISAEDISLYDFDMIIIAIEKHAIQIDIINQLVLLNIPFDKIKLLRNGIVENGVRLLETTCSKYNDNTVLYDSTNITQCDYKTGIQRVVRELYRNLCYLGVDVCAVQYAFNNYITSREFDCRIKNKAFDGVEYKVQSDKKPIFLTDFSWDYSEVFELIRNNENIYVIIYDLIPILNPDVTFDHYKEYFTEWIHDVLKFSSKCLCISQSVANDLISYYRQKGFMRNKPLEIYTFHLGFDVPSLHGEVRDELRDFVERSMTFLTVGTVEPRKNHLLLLHSVKQLFQKYPKQKIQLLILGRDGWKNDDFKRMYEFDDMIKDKVLWVKDASDDEVQWAYRNCSALVYPTKIEGFGLPLVEAARFNLPIICSDIPIIHEIVGDNADYFKVDDVESLSNALVRWIASDIHPSSSKVKMYTWKECAMEVADIFNKRTKPYAVLS